MAHVPAANQYITDILSGTIPACEYVKRACQRQVDDLKAAKKADFPYRFDEAKAERICKFLEVLPHTKGVWASRGETIKLEPWQQFIFTTVFGWVKKSDGNRRFREAYIEVPRKNGKSIIGSGVGLYMFAADKEHGAEVYSGASSEKQAWEVFRPAKLMMERDSELREALGVAVNAKTLNCPADMSRFEPIIGKPGDGSSPSCAIADEFHEHPTDEQVSTMVTGMGARTQPLMLYITTAGVNLGGPCYAKRGDIIKVLEGTYDAPDAFGIIYTLDASDDWTTAEALRKANPNFGVSVSDEFLMAEQRKAVQSAHLQNNFKTKHLNIWCGASAAYFNMTKVESSIDRALSIEGFTGEECHVGIDLASKNDLAAMIALFSRIEYSPLPEVCIKDLTQEYCGGAIVEVDDKRGKCSKCGRPYYKHVPHYYAFCKFYLPEETAFDPKNKQYQAWANSGYLTLTPGNIIDYEYIEEDLKNLNQKHNILSVPHDPHNATQFCTNMQKEGLEMIEIAQNVLNMSEPMKMLEAYVSAGRFHFDGDPILKWMFSNVTAQVDRKDNVYPRKERNENKIDGVVALIMAMGRWLVREDDGGSAYDGLTAAEIAARMCGR